MVATYWAYLNEELNTDWNLLTRHIYRTGIDYKYIHEFASILDEWDTVYSHRETELYSDALIDIENKLLKIHNKCLSIVEKIYEEIRNVEDI